MIFSIVLYSATVYYIIVNNRESDFVIWKKALNIRRVEIRLSEPIILLIALNAI